MSEKTNTIKGKRGERQLRKREKLGRNRLEENQIGNMFPVSPLHPSICSFVIILLDTIQSKRLASASLPIDTISDQNC
jgi:hypothetical protein